MYNSMRCPWEFLWPQPAVSSSIPFEVPGYVAANSTTNESCQDKKMFYSPASKSPIVTGVKWAGVAHQKHSR